MTRKLAQHHFKVWVQFDFLINIFNLHYAFFFYLSYNLETLIYFSTKNISKATQLFDNNRCFLSTKLEWFLKDHVTLKTTEMAAEHSALQLQEYITFYLFICIT